MTKLTLRHIFYTQSYLRWAKTTAAYPGYYSKHSRKRASPTTPDQNPRYDPAADLLRTTFTGTASTDTNDASVSVTAGSYQDLAGNAGATGSTAAFTVDTVSTIQCVHYRGRAPVALLGPARGLRRRRAIG
jgi:hypothetical protein